MTIRSRVKKLEKELNVRGKYYVNVSVTPGESKKVALTRTLQELGISDENVGYLVYWGEGLFESEDRGRHDGIEKLIGYVPYEDVLRALLESQPRKGSTSGP